MAAWGLALSLVTGAGAARALDLAPPLAPPPAVPTYLRGLLAGEAEGACAENARSFARELTALGAPAPAWLDGGGAGDPSPNGPLAFLLGFIPGFGLGHFLFSDDQAGGTTWLVVDIIFLAVWIVLDAALFYPVGPLWFLWWVGDILLPLGWVVEHVFQGLDAYRAATGRRLLGGRAEGEPGAPPRPVAPNLMSLSF